MQKSIIIKISLFIVLCCFAEMVQGQTKLLKSCKKGKIKKVEKLLAKGEPINQTDTAGFNALMYAVKNNYTDVAMLLIDSGIDIIAKNNKNKTAFDFAVSTFNIDVMQKMVEKIAKPDCVFCNETYDKNKSLVTMAIERQELDFANFLISNHFNVNISDSNNMCPLHYAINKGYEKLALHIIASSQFDVNVTNAMGNSYLQYVLQLNKPNNTIAEQLIKKNINIDNQNIKGNTALMVAAEKECIPVLKTLINYRANPYLINKTGQSVVELLYSKDNLSKQLIEQQIKTFESELLVAAFKGQMTKVMSLIQFGVNKDCEGNNGITPLLHAAQRGNTDVVKYLVEKAKVDVNVIDVMGNTILTSAVDSKKLDLLDYFIKKVKLDINKSNQYGNTVLMYAISKGHFDIVNYLLTYGAELNVHNKQFETPLMIAAKVGNKRIMSLLIKKGAKINEYSSDKKTALIYAAENGHLECVQLLVNNYAKIDFKTLNGNTALIYASKEGYLEIVKYLLQKGAGLNESNDDGFTPLMAASYNGRYDLVKYLVARGAKLNVVDVKGFSILDWAAPYEKVYEFLLKKGAKKAEDIDY